MCNYAAVFPDLLIKDSKIIPSFKIIIMSILSFENKNGMYDPTVKEISKKCGYDLRYTKKILKKLKSSKYIEVINPEKGSGDKSNKYSMNPGLLYEKGVSPKTPKECPTEHYAALNSVPQDTTSNLNVNPERVSHKTPTGCPTEHSLPLRVSHKTPTGCPTEHSQNSGYRTLNPDKNITNSLATQRLLKESEENKTTPEEVNGKHATVVLKEVGSINTTVTTVEDSSDVKTTSSKQKPKPPPQYCINFAKRLKKILFEKHGLKRNNLDAWAKDLRLLIEKDGIDRKKVLHALKWYADHYDDPYVPVIESGRSLRQKWVNLQNAIERAGSSGGKEKTGYISKDKKVNEKIKSEYKQNRTATGISIKDYTKRAGNSKDFGQEKAFDYVPENTISN